MHLTDQLDEIWNALAKPAGSYAEITARVNASLRAQSRPQTTFAAINLAIYHLRHAQPGHYGWTIPHCKRGPTQDGRLFRVVVSPTGVAISAIKTEAAREGAYGTVSHVSTIMEHGAKMMVILAPQLPSPKLQRKAKAMVRKMRFIAEEAEEMHEALDEQKWG